LQTFFTSTSYNDVLTGYAVISGGTLTLNVSGSPLGGGEWSTSNSYGYGNYTFVVKGPNASGTGLLLWGASSAGGFVGFQITLSGSSTGTLGFQTFGSNAFTYKSYTLGFDASAAYHNYTVTYGSTFLVYVDGTQLLNTSSAPTVPLQMQIQYEYSTQYYGSWTSTPPTFAYAKSATFTPAIGTKAVCKSSSSTSTASATTKTSLAPETTTTFDNGGVYTVTTGSDAPRSIPCFPYAIFAMYFLFVYFTL